MHSIRSAGAMVAATPAVIILAPILSFSRYHNYPLSAPEMLALSTGGALAGLALGLLLVRARPTLVAFCFAALITLFVDIQLTGEGWHASVLLGLFALVFGAFFALGEQAAPVILASFGAICLSTLLLDTRKSSSAPAPADRVRQSTSPSPRNAGSADPPLFIHVVLDAHIGTGGLLTDTGETKQIEQLIESIYLNSGFSIIPSAYAEFYSTNQSLAHTMNFAASYDPRLARSVGNNQFALSENALFGWLSYRKYRIHVRQTQYLDYCAFSQVPVETCITHRYDSLEPLISYRAPVFMKTFVLAKGLYSLLERNSRIYSTLRRRYNDTVRSGLRRFRVVLPLWDVSSPIVTGPIAGMIALSQLREVLAGAQTGEYYLTHVLLPHGPYIYDRNCQLRAPEHWDSGENRATNPQVFGYYLEQLVCVTNQVRLLVEAVKSDQRDKTIIFLVHGDHGSRMTQRPLFEANRTDDMPRSDYITAFSTHFAIKLPGHTAQVISEPASIISLLKELTANGFSQVPDAQSPGYNPGVFVKDEHQQWVRRPFPSSSDVVKQ
jgi:hypothetical protein